MEERNEKLKRQLKAKDEQIVHLTRMLIDVTLRHREDPASTSRRIEDLTRELSECRQEVAKLRKLLEKKDQNEQRRTDERTGSGTVRRMSVHERVQKAYDRLRRFRLFR